MPKPSTGNGCVHRYLSVQRGPFGSRSREGLGRQMCPFLIVFSVYSALLGCFLRSFVRSCVRPCVRLSHPPWIDRPFLIKNPICIESERSHFSSLDVPDVHSRILEYPKYSISKILDIQNIGYPNIGYPIFGYPIF